MGTCGFSVTVFILENAKQLSHSFSVIFIPYSCSRVNPEIEQPPGECFIREKIKIFQFFTFL
jgi:hypothetical protein